ncbi:hypothetical protein BDZ89DRAFT_527786 [Hymenopellis radicata]|nr:hypothetical protein BDZ89DRAFT_527786 [Hymenopellis radicata]
MARTRTYEIIHLGIEPGGHVLLAQYWEFEYTSMTAFSETTQLNTAITLAVCNFPSCTRNYQVDTWSSEPL